MALPATSQSLRLIHSKKGIRHSFRSYVQRYMPDQEIDTGDKFVEVDGVKYQPNPDNPEEALKDENDELVPFKPEGNKKPDKPEGEDDEPLTRRGAKDFIIKRQQEKIKKLKKDDGDLGDEITPESRDLIRQEIEERVKPVLESVRSSSDSQELQDVLNKYPDAKSFEKQIKKYMDHPAYKDASIEFIFLGLAAKKMQLQKDKEAKDEEAKKTQIGGHQRKTSPKGDIPDVRNMPKKDFEDLVFKVKSGQKF